ncbi:MAG TPA: hypothetical protein VK158_01470 [Acidobacteriota bacterium]|nr:hypothetical protein [Acidobacteriota bacterium]
MTNPTIISEAALSLYDVKKALKAVKKRDEQLSVRSTRCEEYVGLFTPFSDKAAEELREEIKKLDIPRMKEEYINKIIDLAPINAEDVKVIVTGYGITVKAENLQKIADLIADARK